MKQEGGSLRGHFFRHFYTFFGLVPGVFPGGLGIIERCSRDLLGVFWETFFSTFPEVFNGVSQYFSDVFRTFWDNFYFFRGRLDRTLRGPWGPGAPPYFPTKGYIYIYTHDGKLPWECCVPRINSVYGLLDPAARGEGVPSPLPLTLQDPLLGPMPKTRDLSGPKWSQVVPSGPMGSQVVPSGPKWSQ